MLMSVTNSSGLDISFRNLTLGYDGHPAVHHLHGTVRSGSLTAVVGPNGSGKSTLLKGIVGLVKPLSGQIELGGPNLASIKSGTEIAYLPQHSTIDRSFPLTVEEIVALGLWPKRGSWAAITRADRATISDAIATVGLRGFERRTLAQLSGGQLQRALFARVIVQNSRVILLDEPFNAIDAKTSEALLDLIEAWHDERRTVVAVLHNVDVARKRFPDTLLLAREAVAWGPSDQVLTTANIARAHSMAEAFDHNAPQCERDCAA